MTAAKVGDLVRVSIEDVVTEVDGDRISVGADWEVNLDRMGKGTFEVLAPPEPTWDEGDIIACSCDRVFVRKDERWHNLEGVRATGPCLADDLTLLARNGRLVTS